MASYTKVPQLVGGLKTNIFNRTLANDTEIDRPYVTGTTFFSAPTLLGVRNLFQAYIGLGSDEQISRVGVEHLQLIFDGTDYTIFVVLNYYSKLH